METQWEYFDFQNRWKEFHKVWITSPVQKTLSYHMKNWCKDEAYYIDANAKIKPTWKVRSDLWTYSRTDYHSQRMFDKANTYINEKNIISKYELVMKQNGILYDNEDDLYQAFHHNCWDDIEKKFEPIPFSQEANILMMGANYLADPLRIAAEIMFPSDQVLVIENEDKDDITIIANRKIIFDFNREYHYKNNCEDLSPENIVKLWKL